MEFHFYRPSEELAPFVKNYFLMRIVTDQENFKMFPTGSAHLTFFLKGHQTVYIAGKSVKPSGAMLGGQLLKHFKFTSTTGSAFLGIAFQPTAIYKLFNVEAHKQISICHLKIL